MNTDRYARVTVVLDRSTAEDLNYISHRLQHSKSALIREVLAEPVAAMRGVLGALPDGEIDPRQLALAGLDAIEQASEEPMKVLREMAHG